MVRTVGHLLATLLITGTLGFSVFLQSHSTGKALIRTAADLPVHMYPVTLDPPSLLTSEVALEPLQRKVRADVNDLLQHYDIRDRGTLAKLHEVLFRLDCIEHRFSEARQQATEAAGYMDNAADRARFAIGAEIDAKAIETLAVPHLENIEYRAFLNRFLAGVSRTSETDAVSAIKGYCVRFSSVLVEALAIGDMGDAIERNREINLEQASNLIAYRMMMIGRLPQCETTLAVLTPWIDRNWHLPKDFWATRNWELKVADRGTPVNIAIWDTGVDRSVFRGQLALPRSAPIPGMNFSGEETRGELFEPIPRERARLSETLHLLKGWGDTFINIESPEAQLYTQTVHQAKTPAEAVDLDQRIFQVSDLYCHGTSVAGLALETNPFARLIVARFRFDFDADGSKSPSLEGAKKAALAFSRIVNYFKSNQVRVVNMSWGFDLDRIEGDLQKYGSKAMDAATRHELAKSIFLVYQEGMRKALASAPEIVFVAAAGNSSADTAFAAGLPQSLQLSNLLVVGALDRSGSPTFLTSYGKAVKVYAQGQDVKVLLPGGDTAVLMGTSFAAPKVANLIAKLLAVRPTLGSEQVIDLVVRGSVESFDNQLHIIDPEKTRKLLTAIGK